MATDAQERSERHEHLRALLKRLPHTFPEWKGQDFRKFEVDPAAQDPGPAGVLSSKLENSFGFQSRSTGDGIIKLKGRGPALSAVVDLLSKCTLMEPKEAAILDKWTEDLIEATSHALAAGKVLWRF